MAQPALPKAAAIVPPPGTTTQDLPCVVAAESLVVEPLSVHPPASAYATFAAGFPANDTVIAAAEETLLARIKGHGEFDIKELLRLEDELGTQPESATSVAQEAQKNMIKYLQVGCQLQFANRFNALYYEFKKEGSLEVLRSISSFESEDVIQPKVLNVQDCAEDTRLAKQVKSYRDQEKHAQQRLEKLVTEIAEASGGCKVKTVEIKSQESTERKAKKSYGGNVRKVADMARVTLICGSPEALRNAYLAIMGLFEVRRICSFTGNLQFSQWAVQFAVYSRGASPSGGFSFCFVSPQTCVPRGNHRPFTKKRPGSQFFAPPNYCHPIRCTARPPRRCLHAHSPHNQHLSPPVRSPSCVRENV
ncbi:unnamed protein product [Ectocarpus sp. 13 AM-2016]